MTITGKNINEILYDDYPNRKIYVEPIITSHTINMIYAPTGVGKTYLALHLAIALASGTKFLNYKTNHTPKVLYIDGEMGYQAISDRVKCIVAALKTPIAAGNLQFISFEEFKNNPNLSNLDQQPSFEEKFKPYDVVIVDNLDTTTYPTSIKDSDLQMWLRLRPWLLRLRSEGKCIILIHHANAQGGMYGTTKISNSLDLGVALKPITFNYSTSSDNRFRLDFFKGRFLKDEQKQSQWVEVFSENNTTTFTAEPWGAFLKTRISELGDMRVNDICEMLNITKQQYMNIKYSKPDTYLDLEVDSDGEVIPF